MRVDKRTGEHLAVIADVYNQRGNRYYMGIGQSDGCWVELDPVYLTRSTKTVTDYPAWLKRRIDQSMGYIMHLSNRLYG